LDDVAGQSRGREGMMTIKDKLIKLDWLLSSQFGLNLQRFFRSISGISAFLRDRSAFRQGYIGNMRLMPCLHDRYEEGGTTKSEYFWQDLLVAREIYAAKPIKHVDIGSRVDGFVAHVASFRECEVFDVRPISTTVPGVMFRQADLMNAASLPMVSEGGYCDSLSSLHAIEHFGLGRYGDPINPRGYQQGFANMAKLLKPGGTFYLSTPIGQERVEFNANWVFDPRTILQCGETARMKLERLIVITPASGPQEVAIDTATLCELALNNYQLGLFIFKKQTHR
jgi:SAM-dependent methyltransferase